ncbi:hypothetical protein [Runella sp.]|uniref:hypothetical protein n=1 Tax=Runella sp. TaxID=1960881 RepID=UPI003D113755
MKKSLLCGGLILMTLTIHAQSLFIQDINGRPIFENGYTEIEGSPYLNDAWSTGNVKAKNNGKTYELAKMRYDLYKDELEYEENQKPYRFSTEITEFSTNDGVFRSGFPAIESMTARNFYQVLYDGNVKLLKRNTVRIQLEKLYSSATQTKRFMKESALYLFKNGTIIRLKKDKKSLLEALGDKQTQLETFINDEKLKLSKEEDILRVIEKYEAQ